MSRFFLNGALKIDRQQYRGFLLPRQQKYKSKPFNEYISKSWKIAEDTLHMYANGLTKIQVSEEMLFSNYTALLG